MHKALSLKNIKNNKNSKNYKNSKNNNYKAKLLKSQPRVQIR